MADYRRKKRNLNKVDFTNKTKNQSKRYLINQFESLEESKIDMISHEANKVILYYE